MQEHASAARRMVAGGAVVLAAALGALALAAAGLVRSEARQSRESVERRIDGALDEFWASLAQPSGLRDPFLIEVDSDLRPAWEPARFDVTPPVTDVAARFYLDAAERAASPAEEKAAVHLALVSEDAAARVRAAAHALRIALRDLPPDGRVHVDWPEPNIPLELAGTREAVFYEYRKSLALRALDRILRALGTEDDAAAAALLVAVATNPEGVLRFVHVRRRLSHDVTELPVLLRDEPIRRVAGREIRVRVLDDGSAAAAWTDEGRTVLRRIDALVVADLRRRILDPVGVRLVPAVVAVLDGSSFIPAGSMAAVRSAPEEPGREGLLVAGIACAAAAAIAAYAAFVRAVRREAKAAAARADFVATVSHELRTPVAVVRTAAETLLADRAPRPEDRRQLVEAILRESERLSGLVGNVLDFTRIDAGTRRYAAREAAVEDLIEETVRRTDSVLRPVGFHVDVEIPSPLPRLVCDPDALGAAVANLLDNAAKFRGTSDRATVRATVHAVGDVRHITIEVEDHGVGIPDAEKAHVLERFFRGADPRVRETRGSGIGLSLVQHAVDAHGGRVEIADTAGGGTTVRLILPVRRA